MHIIEIEFAIKPSVKQVKLEKDSLYEMSSIIKPKNVKVEHQPFYFINDMSDEKNGITYKDDIDFDWTVEPKKVYETK